MPNPGTVRGTHHLTFCVGPAQEDYDFHTKVLGLKSVKKTALYDGDVPIYHLYYGNDLGDASTIITASRMRQSGWMGQRGTGQIKALDLSVPVGARFLATGSAARLRGHGTSASARRASFTHPCGIHYELVGIADDDRKPYDGGGVSADTASAAPTGSRRRCASPSHGSVHARGHGRPAR